MARSKIMRQKKRNEVNFFPKTPTGINGLDEIMYGGFPKGRPILICGSAGCGKTLMAVQFIIRGITEYDEPGVIMTFEETIKDLDQNVKSLGFDLQKLIHKNKLRIDHVRIEKNEISETGEYDLEGLFIRLNHAIDSIGAKRVVLDTIESIFSGVENLSILRSEIRRLFRWLKEKGVTTIITGERGENTLTRQGLEEYVSDCVILLDFRVVEQIATRRLRIVKYRGSMHGTNEYPFLIDENGISVLPITSLKLDYKVSSRLISTGLAELDNMFSRQGIYQGTSILITGTAGTAKTTLASYFALGAAKRKEKALFLSFEESSDQIVRNMRQIGMDLKPFIAKDLVNIHASRPTLQGLEKHLLLIQKLVDEWNPKTVILDPVSSLVSVGSGIEVKAMLIRVMDLLKMKQVNALFTALTQENSSFPNETVDAVSSLADTWISLKNEEVDGSIERNLRIVKSRGIGHRGSWQNFRIGKDGIRFLSNIKK